MGTAARDTQPAHQNPRGCQAEPTGYRSLYRRWAENLSDIDFDDMTHDYHRYSYKIEHCDANWNVSSSLFESDYMRGFNGNQIIEDVEQSINTNHPYTHYHLAIPNADCQLTMSGNYRLTVYDDNAETRKKAKCLQPAG